MLILPLFLYVETVGTLNFGYKRKRQVRVRGKRMSLIRRILWRVGYKKNYCKISVTVMMTILISGHNMK